MSAREDDLLQLHKGGYELDDHDYRSLVDHLIAALVVAEKDAQPGPEVKRLIHAAEFWVTSNGCGDAENSLRSAVKAVQAVGLTQHPVAVSSRPKATKSAQNGEPT